jgi:hypothetical protein
MVLARMADSVSASALPAGLPAYAGYVDGRWPSFDAIRARFYPHAHCISITTGLHAARFADIEPGDDSIAEAVYWLRDRVPSQYGGLADDPSAAAQPEPPSGGPGLYFRANDLATVLSELHRVMPHLDRRAICLWGAHWTNQLPDTLPAGFDALQVIGGVDLPYDVSVCGPRFLSR